MSGVEPAAPAAPTAADARAKAKGPMWPAWAPKTVVVTVLVTLLTAWLFPAISRQWQDRQRARELTAGLVADIGRNTSIALVTSNFITFNRFPSTDDETKRGFNQQAFNQLDLDWRMSSAVTEAQLQAYYSRNVVARWRSYSDLVHDTYFLITDNVSMRGDTLAALREHLGPRIKPGWNFDTMSAPWVSSPRLKPRRAYLYVSTALLDEKASLIDEVLHDHPQGYSTRPSDLVHDLVPLY